MPRGGRSASTHRTDERGLARLELPEWCSFAGPRRARIGDRRSELCQRPNCTWSAMAS
jgi:hypothetical protein